MPARRVRRPRSSSPSAARSRRGGTREDRAAPIAVGARAAVPALGRAGELLVLAVVRGEHRRHRRPASTFGRPFERPERAEPVGVDDDRDLGLGDEAAHRGDDLRRRSEPGTDARATGSGAAPAARRRRSRPPAPLRPRPRKPATRPAAHPARTSGPCLRLRAPRPGRREAGRAHHPGRPGHDHARRIPLVGLDRSRRKPDQRCHASSTSHKLPGGTAIPIGATSISPASSGPSPMSRPGFSAAIVTVARGPHCPVAGQARCRSRDPTGRRWRAPACRAGTAGAWYSPRKPVP